MATQAYLKSNQDVLEECVTDGLKELLKNKPAAPLQFMADYFAKRHQEKTHAPHVSWPSQGPVPDFVARVTTAAGKAAQEHQQKLGKKAAGEPSWDCQAWLAAEGCSDMLENLLLGPQSNDNVALMQQFSGNTDKILQMCAGYQTAQNTDLKKQAQMILN